MTSTARAFAISRLASCPDLKSLKKVWDSLSPRVQGDLEVFKAKEAFKERLKCKQ